MTAGTAGNVARVVVALALMTTMAGCTFTPPNYPSGEGDGTGTTGDDHGTGNTGDSGDNDDASGGDFPDPCAVLPDDALETALGSPAVKRTPYVDSGAQLCSYESGTDPIAYLKLAISAGGRDEFETSRGYKDDLENLYHPVTGVGDDAFAFGSELTVLAGEYNLVLFLEGLPFDDVPKDERVAREAVLAAAVVAGLG